MSVSSILGSRLVNCAHSKHTRVDLYEKKMTQTPLMIAFQLLHYATKCCHFKCCCGRGPWFSWNKIIWDYFGRKCHNWSCSTAPPVTPFHLQRKLKRNLPPHIWVWSRLVFKCVKHRIGFSEIWNLFSLPSSRLWTENCLSAAHCRRGALSCRWIAHTLYVGLSPQATKQVKWGWP